MGNGQNPGKHEKTRLPSVREKKKKGRWEGGNEKMWGGGTESQKFPSKGKSTKERYMSEKKGAERSSKKLLSKNTLRNVDRCLTDERVQTSGTEK